MKKPINKVDKNAVSLVCTSSHCKREVIAHVQQKFPLLLPYFHICFQYLCNWKTCQSYHRDEYGLEIPTNLQSLHFHGPGKAIIKLAKK